MGSQGVRDPGSLRAGDGLGAWEPGGLGAGEPVSWWAISRGAGKQGAREPGNLGVGKMGARELGALCETQNYAWVPPPPDLGSMPFYFFLKGEREKVKVKKEIAPPARPIPNEK